MREAALCVMRLPEFWLLDLLDMIVTPFYVGVVLEAFRRRSSLLDTTPAKFPFAGQDMQSVHARSPHSLVKRDEFVCYTVGPTILPLCFELFS